MGVEIERKFLLASDAWRAQVERSEPMAQGYLVGMAAIEAGQARSSVRVRIAGDRAWLNIKSATLGVQRQEYEYAVPLDDARHMLDTLSDGVVEKVRHHVILDGAHFEIDEFSGRNQGLVVAEVELPSVDAAYPRPEWLGREVSEQARYYNVNLVHRPYDTWSAAERAGEHDAC